LCCIGQRFVNLRLTSKTHFIVVLHMLPYNL